MRSSPPLMITVRVPLSCSARTVAPIPGLMGSMASSLSTSCRASPGRCLIHRAMSRRMNSISSMSPSMKEMTDSSLLTPNRSCTQVQEER